VSNNLKSHKNQQNHRHQLQFHSLWFFPANEKPQVNDRRRHEVIQEGQKCDEALRVGHGERVVPSGLHERRVKTVPFGNACVCFPVDWILRRRDVVVDRRFFVRVGSNVVSTRYQRIHAQINRHDFGVVFLFDVENSKETGGDTDDDSRWAVHVIDPSSERLFVGWDDDCGAEDGEGKTFGV
jgi:hypothetical protein